MEALLQGKEQDFPRVYEQNFPRVYESFYNSFVFVIFSVLTDIATWKHYFKEKSRIFHEFGSNMRKMQQIMDTIMDKFTNEDVVNFCKYSPCLGTIIYFSFSE